MSSRRHRRRKKKIKPISFGSMMLIFLFIMLIPLLCYWFGMKHVESVVPDHATGHIYEVSASDGI